MVSKRLFTLLIVTSAVACGQPRNNGGTTSSRTTGEETGSNTTPSNTQPVPGNGNVVVGDPNTNTPANPNAVTANPNAVVSNPNAVVTNPNAVADPNAADPNTANPNHLVNFGKPDPLVIMDPNAKAAFNPNQIYAEADNGYPVCETPVQVDFGYAEVAGCPTPIGTQLPMQSYCHINYNFTVDWYETNPPASGDHWPDPSHSLGVNVVPVPREYYLHSMEHGAVVFAYNCPNGCDYEQRVLREVVASRADRSFKVLMTPDSRMPPNTFAAIS